MKSFLVRKQGISNKEADQALEIPPDFDYIELPSVLKAFYVCCFTHCGVTEDDRISLFCYGFD